MALLPNGWETAEFGTNLVRCKTCRGQMTYETARAQGSLHGPGVCIGPRKAESAPPRTLFSVEEQEVLEGVNDVALINEGAKRGFLAEYHRRFPVVNGVAAEMVALERERDEWKRRAEKAERVTCCLGEVETGKCDPNCATEWKRRAEAAEKKLEEARYISVKVTAEGGTMPVGMVITPAPATPTGKARWPKLLGKLDGREQGGGISGKALPKNDIDWSDTPAEVDLLADDAGSWR
jgi:hypothetical protein